MDKDGDGAISQEEFRTALASMSQGGRGGSGGGRGGSGSMFLYGGVKAGIHGTRPNLTDLQRGDLKHEHDFRQVNATVISLAGLIRTASVDNTSISMSKLLGSPNSISSVPTLAVADSTSTAVGFSDR